MAYGQPVLLSDYCVWGERERTSAASTCNAYEVLGSIPPCRSACVTQKEAFTSLRAVSVMSLSESSCILPPFPYPIYVVMPRVVATKMMAQRRSLRVLRAEYAKRKGDLRDLVKTKKSLLSDVRGKITKLEKEVKAAGEEVSEEFDSGSSLFPGSSSESSSEETPAPARKDRPEPVTKEKPRSSKPFVVRKPLSSKPIAAGKKVKPGDQEDEDKEKKGKVRQVRPLVAPGAAAPNHRGSPNAEGILYPGFVVDDPRYCEACEQLRRGFPNATRAHRPKDGPCAWAPLARKG